MSAKAFVLLSGGIDSTTCLHVACAEFGHVIGISVDYGQRHEKEITFAKASCKRLGLPHRTLNIQGVIPKTMLTDPQAEVPNISYDDITGVSPTYVPYRNGLLLSAVTSYVAGALPPIIPVTEEWAIYFGAHAEDARAWAYPDCTPEFIGAQANAIYIGTYQKVRLHTPLQWLDKARIIALGESLEVDWAMTWSCYRGDTKHCGTCPTCRARRAGFELAGVRDPTDYEQVAA
jgi:7-cyano-7-deazaguanine synthase